MQLVTQPMILAQHWASVGGKPRLAANV